MYLVIEYLMDGRGEVMSKIIDCVCYNGEKELFDLRYNILKDYVDEFIVVEFDKTFSGKDKPWYFANQFMNMFTNSRINHFQIEQQKYNKYKELAESSPNTIGAEHWKREFMQKESIKDCLTHLNDNDTVFISDCDEIWDPEAGYQTNTPFKVMQRVYTYYLNNRSTEQWFGTLVSPYKHIKNACLNHLRTNAEKDLSFYRGWHFTSLKGNLKQKLTDSYTEEDYATPQILNQLEENINNNRDFLGRDFQYQVDEKDWPEYLKRNREKCRHLLK